MKNNKKITRLANKIMNILMYGFLVLSMILLLLCVVSKKDNDGAVSLFGYQLRIVVSESMEKCDTTYNDISKYKIKDIPIKSLLLIKTIPTNNSNKFYQNINIGDVLTFRYVIGSKQQTITHRVINIQDKDDDVIIELKGDNVISNHNTNTSSQFININDDNSPNYIIGKVVGKSYILGVVLYSIKQPLGMFLLIIIPSLIIMILEIVKLVSYIYSLKKEKTISELKIQKEELENLKQKLKKLENSEEGGNYV